MSKITLKIKGLEKSINNLKMIDSTVVPKAMEDSLDASANTVLTTMQGNTPKDTGNLRASEKITKGADSRTIGPDPSQAHYALWVEQGHHTRSGSWVPGQFYVERTALETMNTVSSIFNQIFNAYLAKY